LSASYSPALPRVRGNSQRVEQVIVNLLLNACQALEGKGKEIVIATSFDPERAVVLLSVHDEGRGIAAEDLPRLTDPFFTTKREEGGTGLGLSVSAGIVKEHGGSLCFGSLPGEGTTVTLALPVTSENQDLVARRD
jgi:polar amino acid transport system substrate-binding protein